MWLHWSWGRRVKWNCLILLHNMSRPVGVLQRMQQLSFPLCIRIDYVLLAWGTVWKCDSSAEDSCTFWCIKGRRTQIHKLSRDGGGEMLTLLTAYSTLDFMCQSMSVNCTVSFWLLQLSSGSPKEWKRGEHWAGKSVWGKNPSSSPGGSFLQIFILCCCQVDVIFKARWNFRSSDLMHKTEPGFIWSC